MKIIEQEYEIKMEFVPGENNPVLLYQSMAAAIKYMQASDSVLAKSISKENSVSISLVSIKEGSLRNFVRSRTECPENELQPQNKDDKLAQKVEQYFLESKKVITQDLFDLPAITNDDQIQNIVDKVKQVAQETEVDKEPFYLLPTVNDIKNIAIAAEETAKYIGDNSRILFIGKDNKEVELPKRLRVEKKLFTEEKSKIITSERVLILKVKKPDFLGDSRWEMKHGKNKIVCKIVDEKWIERFKNKDVLVFPGDSLECLVQIVEEYEEDGSLKKAEYEIKEVENVIEGTGEES